MNHKKLTKKELHQLKVDMLKNILSVVGGVHYNKYKNFKRKGTPCLKSLSLLS
jgi:hypothetical protein